MSTICLFGAASDKINGKYIEDVEELGRRMGKAGFAMIYGAGGSGLMGAAARGMTEVKGKIIGVTPRFMHKIEPVYDMCTELIDTKTMAERKEVMQDRADAFIIVPGGVGTFDEVFQIITLKELGQLGNKPIVLLNIDGYYNEFQQMMLAANGKGFLRRHVMSMYHVCNDIDDALSTIKEELSI